MTGSKRMGLLRMMAMTRMMRISRRRRAIKKLIT